MPFESFKQEKSPEINQLPKLSLIINKIAEKLEKGEKKKGRTLSDIVYETCLHYGVLQANIGESIENLVKIYTKEISKELHKRKLFKKTFSGEKKIYRDPQTCPNPPNIKIKKITEPALFDNTPTDSGIRAIKR